MSTAVAKRSFSEAKLKELDQLASQAAMQLGGGAEGAISEAVQMSVTMNGLLDAIDDQMLDLFMSLMNTPLGFKTDRDPNAPRKADKPVPQPYSRDVVKRCIVQALLRGVKIVGNQFNIIAGQAYITQEGFAWKVKRLPGISDFKPVIGVPRRFDGIDGMVCRCCATWKRQQDNGPLITESIGFGDEKFDIPVKVDEWTSTDAIIGKARRKFFKSVFDRITGSDTPDGEVGDDLVAPVTLANVKTVKTEADPSLPEEKAASSVPLPDPPRVALIKLMAQKSITEEQLITHLKATRFITRPTVIELLQLNDTQFEQIVDNWENVSAAILKP